MFTKTAIKH